MFSEGKKLKHNEHDKAENLSRKLQPKKSSTQICDLLVLNYLEKSGLHRVKDKLLRVRTVKPEVLLQSVVKLQSFETFESH